MRAARFIGGGKIALEEAPKPVPQEGEALIKVAANGVCGSDRKALERGYPRIPGHEVSGTVVEVGPGSTMEVGTRVAVYISQHCGECAYCRRGLANLCPHKKGLLGWSTDGGYAEYMLVPQRNLLPLEDGVSLQAGVLLLDTIGTSWHALRLARSWEAESALVIGCGPIGLGAVAGLGAFGGPKVYASDLFPYRLRAAEKLGAIPINAKETDVLERIRQEFPYGVNLVVEAVGSLPTIMQSLDAVAPGGKISLVGEYWGQVDLRPKGSWMINDITVIRSFYFTLPEFEENQRLLLEGKVNPDDLISHTFPLEEIDKAYEAFLGGETLKVLVEP